VALVEVAEVLAVAVLLVLVVLVAATVVVLVLAVQDLEVVLLVNNHLKSQLPQEHLDLIQILQN